MFTGRWTRPSIRHTHTGKLRQWRRCQLELEEHPNPIYTVTHFTTANADLCRSTHEEWIRSPDFPGLVETRLPLTRGGETASKLKHWTIINA